jgi:uncharacterized HAD superfamily protein/hypoxanthine phosphoribosyltransferase
MDYRSIANMNTAIVRNLLQIPADIDLVVGIPRSGMLAASVISLHLNAELVDLDGFLSDRIFQPGRRIRDARKTTRRALIIDDSVQTGQEMRRVRKLVAAAELDNRVAGYAAVFGSKRGSSHVDFCFEIVNDDRVFEWNVLHHNWWLAHSCVDIDGVLCMDPTHEQNDDGPRYRQFLEEATPMYVPTTEIACLVTSRLEKYRSETEAWLHKNGVQYRELVMLDLPTASERRKRRAHAPFKAQVYRQSNTHLFIESSQPQAVEIVRRAEKPAYSVETREMIQPSVTMRRKVRSRLGRVKRRVKQLAKQYTTLLILDQHAEKRRV